jgi:uncharacterized protein YggE
MSHSVTLLRWTVGAAALCAIAVSSPHSVRAGELEPGIVVHGIGFATARPSQVELSATINGEAELAADAMVKFRDAKKRAIAAIAALKNPDLSVSPGGVSIGAGGNDANAQMMAMRGMAVPTTSQAVKLSETSRIVLANTDKLEPDEMMAKLLKILDAAKDAGYQIGAAPAKNYIEMQIRAQSGEGEATVSFKLPDSTAVRAKAYKAALDDAKAKAQSLAELSGVKLGRIIAVRDEDLNKDEPNQTIVNLYGFLAGKGSGQDTSLSSTSSGELTLKVNLVVQFEIAK